MSIQQSSLSGKRNYTLRVQKDDEVIMEFVLQDCTALPMKQSAAAGEIWPDGRVFVFDGKPSYPNFIGESIDGHFVPAPALTKTLLEREPNVEAVRPNLSTEITIQ